MEFTKCLVLFGKLRRLSLFHGPAIHVSVRTFQGVYACVSCVFCGLFLQTHPQILEITQPSDRILRQSLEFLKQHVDRLQQGVERITLEGALYIKHGFLD